MRTVDLNAAKVHLPRLLEEIAAGEEINIVKAGKPMARPLPKEPRREPRTLGLTKGRIWISGDFDAQLSEEIMAAFCGARP